MGKIIGIVCLLLVFVVLAVAALRSKPQPTQDTSAAPTPTVAVAPLDVEELEIEEVKVGTGSAVKSGDIVTVHYLGTLLDGTKFDSSYDRGEPFTTTIGTGAVIKGWDEGLIGMQIGGKRKLTIPSSLGYGDTGAGRIIPPGAGLIFEIELVDVKSATQ